MASAGDSAAGLDADAEVGSVAEAAAGTAAGDAQAAAAAATSAAVACAAATAARAAAAAPDAESDADADASVGASSVAFGAVRLAATREADFDEAAGGVLAVGSTTSTGGTAELAFAEDGDSPAVLICR